MLKENAHLNDEDHSPDSFSPIYLLCQKGPQAGRRKLTFFAGERGGTNFNFKKITLQGEVQEKRTRCPIPPAFSRLHPFHPEGKSR